MIIRICTPIPSLKSLCKGSSPNVQLHPSKTDANLRSPPPPWSLQLCLPWVSLDSLNLSKTVRHNQLRTEFELPTIDNGSKLGPSKVCGHFLFVALCDYVQNSSALRLCAKLLLLSPQNKDCSGFLRKFEEGISGFVWLWVSKNTPAFAHEVGGIDRWLRYWKEPKVPCRPSKKSPWPSFCLKIGNTFISLEKGVKKLLHFWAPIILKKILDGFMMVGFGSLILFLCMALTTSAEPK